MNEKSLELRMYFFVPYQLTGIQQGIQCGHAALEYAMEHGDDPQFIEFAKNWKTWVILNGGTTNGRFITYQGPRVGSLNQILDDLRTAGVKVSCFREPDLENALTSVCFICDERVFNEKLYPCYINLGGDITEEAEYERAFIESIGGKTNLFLRNLIRGKRLA